MADTEVEANTSQQDDVIVAIEPELPLDGKQQQANGGATDDAAISDLREQFNSLKSQQEATETARRNAEERAARWAAQAEAATREVASARSEIADRELDTVTTGISAAESEASAAEAAYAKAMEEGNFADAGKAQRRMARAEAQIERLNEAKADIEARRAQDRAQDKGGRKEAPIEAPQRAPTQDDPVEAYIAGRTEPTANWLRAHKDFITDPRKNAKLTAAHWNAVGEGLSPDTPEYFEHVETFVGLKQAPKKDTRRKPGAPVAPVTASSGGTNGGGHEVRLSKMEATAATDGTLVWNYDDPSPQKKFKKGDPIGIVEFARRKKAMTEQGLYDKSYTEQ